MARTKNYQHYCPVARSLEVIGEKWSLLIVRDLLRGPQRFTDLQRTLGAITPKWLTQRLRDLQEAGIIERDSAEGRREVWYTLTPKGRELAPVIEALVVWGIDHALRPPQSGEAVEPGQMLFAMTVYLNNRKRRLRAPARWRFDFDETEPHVMSWDGERWRVRRDDAVDSGAEADVVVRTSPKRWVELITSPPGERTSRFEAMDISGAAARKQELVRTFAGAPASVAAI